MIPLGNVANPSRLPFSNEISRSGFFNRNQEISLLAFSILTLSVGAGAIFFNEFTNEKIGLGRIIGICVLTGLSCVLAIFIDTFVKMISETCQPRSMYLQQLSVSDKMVSAPAA